uniref:RING-type domain-containing protein n=1 Tax=Macrostomum lignano TaxID=282301 RepID=A0A1I8FGT0_9PLAT
SGRTGHQSLSQILAQSDSAVINSFDQETLATSCSPIRLSTSPGPPEPPANESSACIVESAGSDAVLDTPSPTEQQRHALAEHRRRASRSSAGAVVRRVRQRAAAAGILIGCGSLRRAPFRFRRRSRRQQQMRQEFLLSSCSDGMHEDLNAFDWQGFESSLASLEVRTAWSRGSGPAAAPGGSRGQPGL